MNRPQARCVGRILKFLGQNVKKTFFCENHPSPVPSKKNSKEEQDARLIAWTCVDWGMGVTSRSAPCGWVDGRVAKVHLQAWSSPLGRALLERVLRPSGSH